MDDSDRIVINENLLKQVDILQKQIDALVQTLKTKQDNLADWKQTAVAKFQSLENRVAALEVI